MILKTLSVKSTRPPPAYTDIEINTETNSIQVMPTPQASTSTLLPHPSRRTSSDAHGVQVNAHPPIQNRRELQVQPQISSPRRQQQYPPQPQMSIRGGGDRNVGNKPYNWRGEREWTKGLCGCFGDCGTCCTACWCPCMTYSSNRSRRQALERSGVPHSEGGYSCGGDCLLFCFIHSFSATLCGWILEVNERGNTRQRYKIAGNQCGDCMGSWCCLPCVLTQESLEIEGEERSFAEGEQTEGLPRDISQAPTREREGTLSGQRRGRAMRSKK